MLIDYVLLPTGFVSHGLLYSTTLPSYITAYVTLSLHIYIYIPIYIIYNSIRVPAGHHDLGAALHAICEVAYQAGD